MLATALAANGYIAELLHNIVNGLPAFLSALLILLIGYLISRLLAGITLALLHQLRLNERLHTGQGGTFIQRAVPNPAQLLSQLTFWALFLFAVSMAASSLGLPALVEFVRAIYAYIPNVLAALAIFIVAGAVSGWATSCIGRTIGATTYGKLVAAASPILIMGIAIFMMLNQLKIAPAIVTITYAALMGSAALGMALAFGLGGKEVASSVLRDLYEKKPRQKSPVTVAGVPVASADGKHSMNTSEN